MPLSLGLVKGTFAIQSNYCYVRSFLPPQLGNPSAGGWFSRDAQILQRVGAALLSNSKPATAKFERIVIAKDAFALADKDTADNLLQV